MTRASVPSSSRNSGGVPSRLSPAQSDRLASLLAETSRTFALSIPLLDEPLRSEVTIAYLLFRIADTIEDEVDWSNGDKARALNVFTSLLNDGDFRSVAPDLIESLATSEVAHAGYARLLVDTVFVLDCFAALDAHQRELIARHLTRTTDGMALQLETGVPPGDVAGARAYCYAVAGIVGELCTELFTTRNPRLAEAHADLIDLAPRFGEGLQLVNILRDERDDADAGRRYIPNAECRLDLADLAARDLHAAAEYVRTLEFNGASPGTVAFNALNVALAFETLALVNSVGPGAKLSRERVAEMFATMRVAAGSRTPIVPLLERSAACLGC